MKTAQINKYGGSEVVEINTNDAKLKRLAELVNLGKIHPQVDKVFSLDQVRDAFDYLEKEHPRGKVVISIHLQ